MYEIFVFVIRESFLKYYLMSSVVFCNLRTYLQFPCETGRLSQKSVRLYPVPIISQVKFFIAFSTLIVAESCALFVVEKKTKQFCLTCCCELIAHFGDGLAVTAAAIVHAFADKLDLPDAVGQQEALTCEQAHFRHHLREHCSTPASLSTVVVTIAVVARPTGIDVAAAIVVVAGIVAIAVAAVFSAPLAGDAKPVELDHWPVLPVPYHGGLNHFPEKWTILFWFLVAIS
jgi:hypothetical protein